MRGPPRLPPSKVSISASVVVGIKEIVATGKMHNETISVQAVIKFVMDKAAEQAERSLCFVKAEAYASAEAMNRRGTLLDNDDLSDMTAKDLRDHFGRFLKVHSVYAENDAGATSLPSATETLIKTQQQRGD